LYQQRLSALKAGKLYTRLPADSFQDSWHRGRGQPTYQQWQKLLALEARAASSGKGRQRLALMLGDSLSQWFPVGRLPRQQLWVNQGISGDTTGGILQRLPLASVASPETIYIMAGVNDLKRGASDREILNNLSQIVQQLKQQSPQAQLVLQSILPTRSAQIPNERIARLNPWIEAIAQRHGAMYLDLHRYFADSDGAIRPELTTDGIHLSPQGYEVWQTALQDADVQLARRIEPPIEPTMVAERFAQSSQSGPRSGIQLYQQRLSALKAGKLYTRLPADSFQDSWSWGQGQPTYQQWQKLLALEARAASSGKGRQRLSLMLGDSLSQWFPVGRLPGQQLWVNQGISGDTTGGILQRLLLASVASPETIYIMAGVNDLKRGASDREILNNLSQIVQQLKQQSPQAQLVLQSILPTRSAQIPNERIARLNPWIEAIAQRHGAVYLDLHRYFADSDGAIRPELTTDGIHLSPQGYEVWQTALQNTDVQLVAQRSQSPSQVQALYTRGGDP
jgi:lysophospholipase L1-like esterase